MGLNHSRESARYAGDHADKAASGSAQATEDLGVQSRAIRDAVDEVNAEKGTIRVVVTIFGRPTPVELEYWEVEAV